MRTQFLGAAIALTLSQAAATADLTIHVTNISKPEGEIAWVLFDSEAGYKADSEPVLSLRRRVDGESMRVTVHDLPAGEYAVKLYHDANRNGELDANMIGIPSLFAQPVGAIRNDNGGNSQAFNAFQIPEIQPRTKRSFFFQGHPGQ